MDPKVYEFELDAESETEATKRIRELIRETGDQEASYVFFVPFLLGTGQVVNWLEGVGYNVEPMGWKLTITSPYFDGAFFAEEGEPEDYWSMRRRLG